MLVRMMRWRRRLAPSLEKGSGVGVELSLAPCAAEKILAAGEFAYVLRSPFVDLHAADRIDGHCLAFITAFSADYKRGSS
jgi:hypothetical protein